MYLSKENKQKLISWLKEKNSWNLNELEYYRASEFDVTLAVKSSYYDLFHETGMSWEKSQKKNSSKYSETIALKKEEI